MFLRGPVVGERSLRKLAFFGGRAACSKMDSHSRLSSPDTVSKAYQVRTINEKRLTEGLPHCNLNTTES